MAALLGAGKPVLLRGDAFATPHGTVIATREIGTSIDDLRQLDTKKPDPKRHGD